MLKEEFFKTKENFQKFSGPQKSKIFEDLKEKIKPYFEQGGSHAFDHTERVYNMALKLSKDQKVDLDVIKASTLLHDIARLKEDNNECKCHAEHGAEIAEKILKEMNFPEEKIKEAIYAIKVHRHSKKIKAKTKEAKILQDADRLDALGAITIARMFSTGGKLNKPLYKPDIPFRKVQGFGYHSESTIHGFHARVLKLTPETFNTKEAKEIAKERYKFVELFLDQFLKEWEGKL